MVRLSLFLAAALSFAQPALGDPNPQLVRSVENRLLHYGYRVDASEFALPTIARLHLLLSSSDPYLKKKREIRHILRNPKYKE